jgi:choline monooxygenase
LNAQIGHKISPGQGCEPENYITAFSAKIRQEIAMDTRFALDPRIATASTPPAGWYTDPAMLALEREKIFRHTWQFAAPLELLRFPGNYAAVDVIGTPVVLMRGQDNVLRAFHNVCRHRAGVVARGCGNRKSLQCQYHGGR